MSNRRKETYCVKEKNIQKILILLLKLLKMEINIFKVHV